VVAIYRKQGYLIAFVGAAAKAMTVINAAQVTPDYFYDEAELKISRYPPGLQVAIKPLTDCARLQSKTLFVITAWNFKDELMKKIRTIGVPENSLFYFYFPKPEFETA
jgi:hypothetical protein